MKLRRLNSLGIDWFRQELASIRTDPSKTFDRSKLEDSTLTEVVSPTTLCTPQNFVNKRQAALYLDQTLPPLDASRPWDDAGLWAWLSMFFLDDVCPVTAGRRKVLQDPHYIPDPDYRRRYRHLLATPLRVLREIPTHNRLFLDAPIHQHGEAMEQLTSKLYVMRIAGAAEAVELLYFNAATGRPKSGLFPTEPQAGDLRNRFPIRLRQLSLTYDIGALDGKQLISLLGQEFDKWAS